MIHPFIKKSSLTLAAVILSIGSTLAAPYQNGERVEPFTAKDQHEKSFTLNPDKTHYLLVSHDMETGKKANAVFDKLGKDYLGSKQAVYVANIHGMPGIGRMFAMPKMRKYAHRIILGDDAALIAKFPENKGKVTVITVVSGKVSSVGYWSPGTEALDGLLK